MNCQNAAEMWSKLVSVHEQKTALSKELLWQRFYDYKMSDGSTIAAHIISKIKMMAKQLKDIDERLIASAICSKVINGLPPKYNAFRTAWDCNSYREQTLVNLMRLLKEELRMANADDETTRLDLQVQALQAKVDSVQNQPSSYSDKAKRPISELKKITKCNYCHFKGHWARECKKRIADENKRTTGSTDAYLCDISMFYSESGDGDQNQWICD